MEPVVILLRRLTQSPQKPTVSLLVIVLDSCVVWMPVVCQGHFCLGCTLMPVTLH